MLPDDDKRYAIKTCRNSEKCLKKWVKINDIQLVHLLVVWYLVNLQDARCNNKDGRMFILKRMLKKWIVAIWTGVNWLTIRSRVIFSNTITKFWGSYHGGNFQPAEKPLTLSNSIPYRQNLLIITSALSDIKADHNNEHAAEYNVRVGKR